MAVIAIIRDAQGPSDSELLVVYLLPIVWMSLYGRRLHLLVGLFCMDLALMVPILLVGAPNYPLSTWRQVVVLVIVTTMVASTISTMVHRDRIYVSDLAQQSLLAKRNADDAHNARERLETLLRAATGSAIMGVDPAGTVTFFSAGAELMLGYNASEVVGIRSIADFIDPAQITERRQTIDAMRKALDPVYPETVAEVPWTARRKNGEQRRCVVRVRTLPTQGGAEGADSGVSAGYVVVAIDVTEREELAAERERLYSVQQEVTQSLIEQNNRLRELTKMKDDIVATVSHELRTPITSIRGFIELLLDGVPELSEDQMRMLRTIDRNSAQLQRVAEDLLADPGGGHGLRVTFTAARPAPVGRRVGARRTDRRRHDEGAAFRSLRAPRSRYSATPPGCISFSGTCSPTPSSSPTPGGTGERGGRHDRRLRPGPRPGPRPGHPRSGSPPALRAVLPSGGSHGDGRARDRPRSGHRQIGGRGPRGIHRHRRPPRLVHHLPRLSPAAPRRPGGAYAGLSLAPGDAGSSAWATQDSNSVGASGTTDPAGGV